MSRVFFSTIARLFCSLQSIIMNEVGKCVQAWIAPHENDRETMKIRQNEFECESPRFFSDDFP